MPAERAHPDYVTIWVWLVVLALVSVGVSLLPWPKTLINTVVFLLAAAKAALVMLYFMHMRFERFLVWALVLIPLSFFIILTAVLVRDIQPH